MQRPFVQWIGSATEPGRLPPPTVPEVAFAGRSNVGKSSLINALAGQSVARVSQTPGRTRAIHLMDVRFDSTKNPVELRLVDLPGYGYARVSKAVAREWPTFLEPYLAERPVLALCVVLVDAGLPPQPLDVAMVQWLRSADRPFLVVATKADKPNRATLNAALTGMKAAFGAAPLPVSARTGDQVIALWHRIRQACRPA
jgi:GTP-binding protein